MQSIEDYRAEKAERIAECIKDSALVVMKIASDLVRHKRKRPRITSKRTNYRARRLYKRKTASLQAALIINPLMTSCQLGIILSQPIPKFPHGTNNNQQAIVGEYGKEKIEIFRPNNTPGKQE